MTLRILVADDHRIFREGLCAMLRSQADLDVIAEAEDGRLALKLALDLKPDVVVMDLGMPSLNGVEATRRIVSESPAVRVLALSMHSDKRFVSGALSAGASGYLLKDCAFEELSTAIRTVAAGKAYLSPAVAHLVVEGFVRHAGGDESQKPGLAQLTPREREVLQLIAEGRTVAEIAEILAVSQKTVETHRQQIKAKLNLQSVAQLTKYAIREGLTSLEE